jgi:hypothetical protein
MRTQYLAWPLLAAVATTALVGCGSTEAPKKENAADAALTVTDARGWTVPRSASSAPSGTSSSPS